MKKEGRWIVRGVSVIDGTEYGLKVLIEHPSYNVLLELAEEWGGPAGEGAGNYKTNVDINIEFVNTFKVRLDDHMKLNPGKESVYVSQNQLQIIEAHQ